MSGKPILQEMIDEITTVLDKYRGTYQINYAEVIGALEIISRDIYSELTEEEDEGNW